MTIEVSFSETIDRLRQPRVNAQAPVAPIIDTSGESATVEAMVGVINEAANPFLQAPPEHQGTVGRISHDIHAALGVIETPTTLLDTGFAMATADIAGFYPALPAATLVLGLHLGWPHGHAHPPSCIPPAPPIPLPSIGTVVAAGAVNVRINGLPAARAGDLGIAITCGSLAPPFEIVLGSSSVFIGGSRAARMLDMTRHDSPSGGAFSKLSKAHKVKAVAGVAAEAAPLALAALDVEVQSRNADHAWEDAEAAKTAAEAEAAAAHAEGEALAAKQAALQLGADAVAFGMQMLIGKDPAIGPGIGLLMFGSPNVRIGGFPCPNLMESLKGLLKAAAGTIRPRRPQRDIEQRDAEGATSVSPCVCPRGGSSSSHS